MTLQASVACLHTRVETRKYTAVENVDKSENTVHNVPVSLLCPAVVRLLRHRSLNTMATNGSFSMAFITVPDIDVAKKLAGGLVQQKLAACVNIIPGITSVYEWEGKINEDPELLMMVKTATEKVDDVSKYIRENHPYDVAEVISTKIDNGNPPYMKWLGEVLTSNPTETKS